LNSALDDKLLRFQILILYGYLLSGTSALDFADTDHWRSLLMDAQCKEEAVLVKLHLLGQVWVDTLLIFLWMLRWF